MTENDLIYIKRLLEQKKIIGPVLELGAGYGGDTCRKAVMDAGLAYYASDMNPSPVVDFVIDFESDNIEAGLTAGIKFKSILILNVLEHSFNPIRILDNATKLLGSEGALVVITPTVWTLHYYPIDCYRLLPNWYERYAESRKMTLDLECFEYIGYGPVIAYLDANGDYQLPPPKKERVAYWRSRIVHRLFNTFGRGMAFPSHVAIGAVIKLNRSSSDGSP